MSFAVAVTRATLMIGRTIIVATFLCVTVGAAQAQMKPTPASESMATNPAMQAWRLDTHARIANIAQRLAGARLHGRTIICLAVNRGGLLVAATVLKSSGNPELDGAAIAAIKVAAPFAPLPAIYRKPVLAVGVPITFRTGPHPLGSFRLM